jgi:hypothetical protein
MGQKLFKAIPDVGSLGCGAEDLHHWIAFGQHLPASAAGGGRRWSARHNDAQDDIPTSRSSSSRNRSALCAICQSVACILNVAANMDGPVSIHNGSANKEL